VSAEKGGKKMAKRNLLVCHGDLDGIISAVCAIQYFELALEETEITFVQPFTVDKVAVSDEVEKVFVIDVAVNNRDPEMTKNFIRRIGDRLVKWIDHHQGWSADLTGYNPAFLIIPKARSCASILYNGVNADLVDDAEAADTRSGRLSWRAQLIEQATKANMADDNIRLLAVKWLLGDESARAGLEVAAKKYAEIQAETERLAATFRVTGKVALVDARESTYQYDLTQLLLAGQKLAPFAVVVTVHPQQGEGLTIATSCKDVNLVELFGLGSGAPFRVSLPAKRLEEALAKLATV
jgi:hypothetical protein